MGVDCKVNLPANCSVSNVAKVIAAVCGGEKTKVMFGDHSGTHCDQGWFAQVTGYEVTPTSVPEMAQIILTMRTLDGERDHFVNYHFEASRGEGRVMMPRSTAFWLAVMHRVVDFFGGRIDYQDCDDKYNDYEVPAGTWEENSPEDGEAWYDLQNRILALEPITVEEWQQYDKDAAYKIRELR
jgi:uncharacterized glyoxalase superfamily protein PhnB